jgi:hypothetical protein
MFTYYLFGHLAAHGGDAVQAYAADSLQRTAYSQRQADAT